MARKTPKHSDRSDLGDKPLELWRHFQAVIQQFKVLENQRTDERLGELNLQEVRVVEHLGENGPAMMRELAETLLVAVNTMTSIVDGLEAKQIVTRERSPDDRRVVRVALTRTGQATFKASLGEKISYCRLLLSALNDDEQEIYMVLMRKVGRVAAARVSGG